MLQFRRREKVTTCRAGLVRPELLRLLQHEDGGRDALDVLQGQVLRREMHRRQMPVRQVSLRDKSQTGHRAPSDLTGTYLVGRATGRDFMRGNPKSAHLDDHPSALISPRG